MRSIDTPVNHDNTPATFKCICDWTNRACTFCVSDEARCAQCHRILDADEGKHIGVLPLFVSRRWHPLFEECIESSGTLLMKRMVGMTIDTTREFLMCCSHILAQDLNWHLCLHRCFVLDPVVSALLEFKSERRITGANDSSVPENVYNIRYDVIQQTLIVCDHNSRVVG